MKFYDNFKIWDDDRELEIIEVDLVFQDVCQVPLSIPSNIWDDDRELANVGLILRPAQLQQSQDHGILGRFVFPTPEMKRLGA